MVVLSEGPIIQTTEGALLKNRGDLSFNLNKAGSDIQKLLCHVRIHDSLAHQPFRDLIAEIKFEEVPVEVTFSFGCQVTH